MPVVAISKISPKTTIDEYEAYAPYGLQKFLSKDLKTIMTLNLSWPLFYQACLISSRQNPLHVLYMKFLEN
jgi:hypothetical protein